MPIGFSSGTTVSSTVAEAAAGSTEVVGPPVGPLDPVSGASPLKQREDRLHVVAVDPGEQDASCRRP